ncbi:FG-GAP-like repeat-containing protein [Streptomyces diastatochromogenes]|nr:FG-GAP-like repeat-containing protein [Streptomyces diastatochromogenes]
MTPGDLNKDGLPEIWARDKVKGTIHEYQSKKLATPDPSGVTLDLRVFLDEDGAVRTTSIGSGFTGTAFPHLTTTGDFENDGYADLWSRDGAGRTVEFPGRALSGGSSFGPERYLATTGYDWADCKSFPAASGTGTFSVCGPILGKYLALGGPTGYGKPTSGVTNVSDGGRFVNFAAAGTTTTNRTISWSKSTGAWAVSNGVFSKWNSTGRETGVLGYPTSDERPTHVGDGKYITFSNSVQKGAIYWRSGIGSQMIRGKIYNSYLKLGGVARFGYPTGDMTGTGTLNPVGLVQQFRQETSSTDNVSLYWSGGEDAWPVSGAIRTHWLSLGGPTGTLGFPKSDEKTVFGGQRSDFQNGYIRWNRESGVAASHAWTDRTASVRTDLAGDYDGDGRTDIFTVYDNWNDSISLYAAKANAEGGHNPPQEYHSEDAGDWNNGHAKWTAGDFDGDGRDDLMGFHGYSDGSVTAFSFLTQAAGRPVQRSSIKLTTGWDWSRSTPMAGDLNGDGRDDLVFVYDYGNGDTGFFKALARTDGTFDNPVLSHRSGAGNWWTSSARYAVGDTNGDGRDDLIGFYGYASGEARLFTYTAQADGTLGRSMPSWYVPAGTWERERVKLTTGDYNKDGREDLAVMYGYDDGRTDIRIFHARADGGFDGFVTPYSTKPGDWYATSTGNLVSGDANGDGRPDIAVSYNYANGSTRVFTFYGNAAGTVDAPTRDWYAAAGTW